MPKKHESILDKIAHIIQQGEHFARHGEHGSAEAAFARADAMMTKYAIDAALVAARAQDRAGVEREKPETRDIPWIPYGIDFYFEYETMLAAIAKHCRVRIMFVPSYQEDFSKATAVGFPADLDYMQMVWNSVYFAFVSRLDPKWDTSRTVDENIKILKEAGWKWGAIAKVANEHGFECTASDGRLKAAYRRQCKLEGVEPTAHTQRHAAYRAAYAEGFEATITTRLWRMRKAAKQQVSDTPGSAVALRDRMADVENVFFELFPTARPMTEEEMRAARERFEAREQAEKERWAKLTPQERAKEDRQRARERRAYERRTQRDVARMQDDAGRQAGSRAAESVDLGGTKVATQTARGIES